MLTRFIFVVKFSGFRLRELRITESAALYTIKRVGWKESFHIPAESKCAERVENPPLESIQRETRIIYLTAYRERRESST